LGSSFLCSSRLQILLDVFDARPVPGSKQQSGGTKEEEGKEPCFAGRWVTCRGNIHTIGLGVIQWSTGNQSEFHAYTRPPVCLTKIGRAKFTGKLMPDDIILWSDGDVWVRDTQAPGTKTYEVLGHVGLPFTKYLDPLRRYQEALNDRPSMPIMAPDTAAHAPPAEGSEVRLQKLDCNVCLKAGGGHGNGSATPQTMPAVSDLRQKLPHSAVGRLLPSSSSSPPGTASLWAKARAQGYATPLEQ